jgi:hypothetical protein
MPALPVSQPHHNLTTEGVSASSEGIYIGNNIYILSIAGVPTGGDGWAGIGTLVIDRTNKDIYMNTGTLATPTWTKKVD